MSYSKIIALLFVVLGLNACSTPYSPPVHVNGAGPFPGLVDRLDKSRPLDVVLVHGMCTHGEDWAYKSMNELLLAVDASLPSITPPASAASAVPKIHVVQREAEIGGSKLRMTALVWSPLTAELKAQLRYDMTGTPTDCANADDCKPTRASVNGKVKDSLLNDCLADAIVYEGVSRPLIRQEMVAALTNVLEAAPADAELILLSDSLGSKIAFDALSEMLSGASTAKAQLAAARLAMVFMKANQLPILGLADQKIRVADTAKTNPAAAPLVPVAPVDSLQRYLQLREKSQQPQFVPSPGQVKPLDRLMLVAFTDPNDLLSYRLMPSRYSNENVSIADVLVSNAPTYFGFIERPDVAHVGYDTNPEVTSLVACGKPRSTRCK